MRYRELGKTGLGVSVLGFGASPFGDVFQKVEPEDCQRAVDTAVDSGINFFDVAPYYGNTLAEERLGHALKGKRKSVYVATKCGRYGVSEFDFSKKRILASIDESLTRLQTDYVDLLQAHDIEFADMKQLMEETIPALTTVKEQGKARFIGITGYQLRMMAELIDSQPVDTVLSYCRSNLLIDDMKDLLLPTVRKLGIGLINASPFHMGLLAPAEPPAWHPAPEEVKRIARGIVSLCSQNSVSASQFGLRYCLDGTAAATTLVGMATANQVTSNLQALDMEIDAALVQKIECLVAPVKNAVWSSGRRENADYERNMEPKP